MPKSRRDALELDRFLPYRLSVLANTMSAAIASHYKARFQLSIPEWRIMAVLARQPGLVAADVAERTAMDKVAVSRGVARLAARGYLSGRAVRSDLRRLSLRLTPRGRAVYGDVAPWALAYQSALLAGLTPREQRTLDRALARLADCARQVQAPRVVEQRERGAASRRSGNARKVASDTR